MGSYRLTKDAEKDLQEVASYTLDTWGFRVLLQYQQGLKNTFEAIGQNKITAARRFSHIFPDLLVTKYRYHYIFYFVEGMEKPVIVGVIHEKRDIVARLSDRLD